jgi:hypothetical protein
MQAEILAANPQSKVRILAVNGPGYEAGNDFLEHDLPCLQDGAKGPWTTWNPIYRDVVVLDGENRKVAVTNLTDAPLAEYSAATGQYETNAANYAALKQVLLGAAGEDLGP